MVSLRHDAQRRGRAIFAAGRFQLRATIDRRDRHLTRAGSSTGGSSSASLGRRGRNRQRPQGVRHAQLPGRLTSSGTGPASANVVCSKFPGALSSSSSRSMALGRVAQIALRRASCSDKGHVHCLRFEHVASCYQRMSDFLTLPLSREREWIVRRITNRKAKTSIQRLAGQGAESRRACCIIPLLPPRRRHFGRCENRRRW